MSAKTNSMPKSRKTKTFLPLNVEGSLPLKKGKNPDAFKPRDMGTVRYTLLQKPTNIDVIQGVRELIRGEYATLILNLIEEEKKKRIDNNTDKVDFPTRIPSKDEYIRGIIEVEKKIGMVESSPLPNEFFEELLSESPDLNKIKNILKKATPNTVVVMLRQQFERLPCNASKSSINTTFKRAQDEMKRRGMKTGVVEIKDKAKLDEEVKKLSKTKKNKYLKEYIKKYPSQKSKMSFEAKPLPTEAVVKSSVYKNENKIFSEYTFETYLKYMIMPIVFMKKDTQLGRHARVAQSMISRGLVDIEKLSSPNKSIWRFIPELFYGDKTQQEYDVINDVLQFEVEAIASGMINFIMQSRNMPEMRQGPKPHGHSQQMIDSLFTRITTTTDENNKVCIRWDKDESVFYASR